MLPRDKSPPFSVSLLLALLSSGLPFRLLFLWSSDFASPLVLSFPSLLTLTFSSLSGSCSLLPL